MINSDYDKLMLDTYRRVFENIRERGIKVNDNYGMAFHEIFGMSVALKILEGVIEEKREESDRQMFEFLNEVVKP